MDGFEKLLETIRKKNFIVFYANKNNSINKHIYKPHIFIYMGFDRGCLLCEIDCKKGLLSILKNKNIKKEIKTGIYLGKHKIFSSYDEAIQYIDRL